MEWEEKFKAYRDKTPQQIYEEKYGPVVGPWLLEFEDRDLDGQASWRAKLRYEGLQEFFKSFTDDVPVQIQKEYLENPGKNFILENLKSHDWQAMWKTMQKFFGANAGELKPHKAEEQMTTLRWEPQGSKEVPIQTFTRNLQDEKSEIGKGFRNILKFYGYFVTRKRGGIAFPTIFLEPEYPETAADFVFRECDSTGYTITSYENVPVILEKGLRCRNGNRNWWVNQFKKKYGRYPSKAEYRNFNLVKYRDFPERIYFCAFPSNVNALDELKSISRTLGKDWETCGVFKIDLKGLNLEIYRDPSMQSKNAFFTYTNIPKQRLTLVKEPEKVPGPDLDSILV